MKDKRKLKTDKYFITGLTVLAIALLLIIPSRLNILLFPTSEVGLNGGFEFGSVTKEYIFVQELPVKKDYLNAVDLVLFSPNQQYRNDNTILVLDTAFRILFQKQFTNEGLDKPKYVTFKFPDKIFVGRGNKVILVISSVNGENENALALPRKKSSNLGRLTVSPMENNDVIGTLKGGKQVFPIEGSFCLRTYETNTPWLNWTKILLGIGALILSLFIIFADKIKLFLLIVTIAPEKVFAALALFFGLILVFVTPPLQVPDENQHFYRSYQISNLQFFKYSETFPASLKQLADSVKRLNFGLFEKFSPEDRMSVSQIELRPEKRIQETTPDYIIPFLPQGLGMMAGRIIGVSPLWLIYFGRIGNLLISIILIFFAIRIIPVSKWILFLLALMPMTFFQMASLSYDVITLALTFLFTGLILKYSMQNRDQRLSNRELGLLFLVIFLLGLCKLPYALVGLLFLMLPVKRLGNLNRYIVILILFIAIAFSGSQLWTIRNLFKPGPPTVTIQPAVSFQFTNASQRSDAPPAIAIHPTATLQQSSPGQQPAVLQPTIAEDTTRAAISNSPSGKGPESREAGRYDQTKADSRCDPSKQTAFILENPFRYLSILFDNTFFIAGSFYLETFVGKLGWLIVPLPGWIINLFWLILICTALLIPTGDFRLRFTDKLIMLAVFFLGMILIETAMYLYWTPLGAGYVEGVQGRYFIPLAPLLLMVLSGNHSKRILRFFNDKKSVEKVKIKQGNKTKQKVKNSQDFSTRLIWTKNLYACSIILFVFIILIATIYFIVAKYYYINI